MPTQPRAQLVPVHAGTLARIHRRAADTVFWELDPPNPSSRRADTEFAVQRSELDKEAWLIARCYEQYPIGHSIAEVSADEGALATILFCPPEFAPGASRFPTAPISQDAWVITSLHIDARAQRRGYESVLLDATIAAATSAGAQALEVFGLHEPSARDSTLDDATAQAHSPIARHAAAIGLTEVPILESAGFRIVDDHPLLPRLRLSLPPVFDLMADQEIADLLAEVPAV